MENYKFNLILNIFFYHNKIKIYFEDPKRVKVIKLIACISNFWSHNTDVTTFKNEPSGNDWNLSKITDICCCNRGLQFGYLSFYTVLLVSSDEDENQETRHNINMCFSFE